MESVADVSDPMTLSHSRLSLCVDYGTMVQGYLFASDVKMYTRICLGDVPFVQCINKQCVLMRESRRC